MTHFSVSEHEFSTVALVMLLIDLSSTSLTCKKLSATQNSNS